MDRLNLADYNIEQNKVETEKIQQVLDEASNAGGLTVVVPRGTYIAGTLNLGCASLYLEKGAVLKASPDFADYVDNGFVHNEMRKTLSFLYSMNHEDIMIAGEGTIDLSGCAFYNMNEANVPDYGIEFDEEQKSECTRPIGNRPTQPIFFYNCNDITVKDIKIVDAPCWTMSFNACENFVISDCVMHSVSKAVVFGYIHSIVRNVTMTNCVISDSQRGICIMSSKGTGVVEHLLFDNIRIDTRVRAGNWWGNGEAIEIIGLEHNYPGYLHEAPERDEKVNVRDIRFKNISCSSENVIAVVGEDNNIEDITIDGLYFEKKDSKNRYLKGNRTIDVSPAVGREQIPEDGEYWLYATGCKNLRIENATIKEFHGEVLKEYTCINSTTTKER